MIVRKVTFLLVVAMMLGTTVVGFASLVSAADPGDTSSLKITSGTSTFSGISSSNKQITVSPGASISGQITMTAISAWNSSAVITLVGTPSWGTHSTSYFGAMSILTPATTTKTVTVSLTAPSSSGTYYIIFLFSGEYNGAQVASLTNWAYGSPVWNDGNDLADFTSSQVSDAQSVGRTSVRYLVEGGYQWINRPADVITVNVQSSALPPVETQSSAIIWLAVAIVVAAIVIAVALVLRARGSHSRTGDKAMIQKAQQPYPMIPATSGDKAFCPYCGHQLVSGAEFCAKCGRRLK